ncbi:hypothetical protein [Frigidibacter sp. MR17.24]
MSAVASAVAVRARSVRFGSQFMEFMLHLVSRAEGPERESAAAERA